MKIYSHAGEQCLYWREVGNRFHTVQWKGPGTFVAVQRDPNTGAIDTYWLAHGAALIRAGRQHVCRLVGQDGLVNGPQRAEQALLYFVNGELSELLTCDASTISDQPPNEPSRPSPKKAKVGPHLLPGEPDAAAARPESVRSLSYEPTEPIDDLPKDPAEDQPDPVADPSSGLDLPTDPGLDLPEEPKRLELDLRDSTKPQPSPAEAAASSSSQAGPGLRAEPLPQDVPIPDDDDDESEQPMIAADNTITQPPSLDVQFPSPVPGLSFAECRRQQERQETSWLRSPLWPMIHEHPEAQSPGRSKRAKHDESVNIAVELFPNGYEGSTFQPDGTMIRKPMRSTWDPQLTFGALKIDFW